MSASYTIKRMDIDEICTDYCKSFNPLHIGSPCDPEGDDIRDDGGIIFRASAMSMIEGFCNIDKYYEEYFEYLLNVLAIDIKDNNNAIEAILSHIESLKEKDNIDEVEKIYEILDEKLPDFCFQVFIENGYLLGECYLNDDLKKTCHKIAYHISEKDNDAELKKHIYMMLEQEMDKFLHPSWYQDKCRQINDICEGESQNLNPFRIRAALLPAGYDIRDRDGIVFHANLTDMLDTLSHEAASRLLREQYADFCCKILVSLGENDINPEENAECILAYFYDDETIYDTSRRQKVRDILMEAEPLHGRLCLVNNECLQFSVWKGCEKSFYNDSLNIKPLDAWYGGETQELCEALQCIKNRLHQYFEREDMTMKMRPF